MFSKIVKIGLGVALCSTLSFATTADEAKTFVEKAAKLCAEKGEAECINAFNVKEGEFIQGELYIFGYDFNGTVKAFGGKPQMVGKNLFNLKGAGGKMLIQELVKTAKTGEGWVDYKWSNPVTNKIADKTSFVKKINDNFWIGAGYYK
ncbi:MAG: cache domain-containing protein [Arcobacter sp.]|uniref:cache domain-containing protein n=1 Tax=Arcobacter sp. TaxID=1872629 RepID=UPI003B00FE8A